MKTLEVLQDMLMKEFSLGRPQVPPDVALSTLGIDSLDFIDFMFRIEERFALKLKDDTPASLVTLNDVARYIDSLIPLQEADRLPTAQPAAIE